MTSLLADPVYAQSHLIIKKTATSSCSFPAYNSNFASTLKGNFLCWGINLKDRFQYLVQPHVALRFPWSFRRLLETGNLVPLSEKKKRSAWPLLLWIVKKCTLAPFISDEGIRGRSWDLGWGCTLLPLLTKLGLQSWQATLSISELPKSIIKGKHPSVCEAIVHVCKLLQHNRLSPKLRVCPSYRHEPSRRIFGTTSSDISYGV